MAWNDARLVITAAARPLGNTDIAETYRAISNTAPESNILRHLLLRVEGGIYSDPDTVSLVMPDDRGPRERRSQVRLDARIEHDSDMAGATGFVGTLFSPASGRSPPGRATPS